MDQLTLDDQLPMLQALHARGPAADRATQMMLYGQFIGSWNGRMVYRDPDGTHRESSADVYFGWVLEGRAVQDVWIAPSRDAAGEPLIMYGTTLRVYEPERDVWYITWIDPVRQAFNRMTGRKIGDDIVQEYQTEHGTLNEWRFTEITADSFHWMWRESTDGGEGWHVRVEFFLRRRV